VKKSAGVVRCAVTMVSNSVEKTPTLSVPSIRGFRNVAFDFGVLIVFRVPTKEVGSKHAAKFGLNSQTVTYCKAGYLTGVTQI